MYCNGDRKTVSELIRDAAKVRRLIDAQAAYLEQMHGATTSARCLLNRMLHIFARELDVNDIDPLLTVLASTSEDLDIANVPLVSVAIALSNEHFTNTKHIRAVCNRFVDDNSVIFLAGILRFSPVASQIELLDISGTRVTEKGLFFLLSMMQEREMPFTLIAKDLVLPEKNPPVEFKRKYQLALEKVRGKSNCTLVLSSEC
ncbi:hypothetical protein TraAM80_00683 [Trypanosoma rangeli]|uniref:Uncharacterized protein n=1 Tax=Trypanosoma rangeli TaxID=5698 RepID=A0A422P2B0_TRYRA|nr:uncharacterized protein TraAM80_00683 [Trypanosoma rangeli]RNF11848.1 hypothetical protein TraAM80_00683 [Trypanosoma rangeli]|eukprot:RNF11848.1 hypothetical protein TraAM80_00683 [Trypanosoma rangeli]